MRTLLLPLLCVVLIALPTSAQQPGKFGLGAGLSTGSTDLFGKVWASDMIAVRFELGFENKSNGPSETDFTFGGGVEYHWTKRKVSPYVAGVLMFESLAGARDVTIFSLFGGWGVEYWWEKNFTLSGEAGITFSSRSNGGNETVFRTTQSAIRLTYYF